VALVLLLVAAGVAAFTVFNATRLTALSAERAELEGRIERDRGEAERIRAEARSAAAGVDPARLGQLAAGTREANALITARTFSWSRFFDIIEGALPYDVRLVGVAHRVEGDDVLLVLNVVAQQDEHLNEFVRAMLETGVFFDVLPTEKTRNEDSTVSAIVETYYLPPGRTGRGGGAADRVGGGRP
jgi:hypothetical protein